VLLLVLAGLIAIAVWMLWWHPLMDIVSGLILGGLCIAPLAWTIRYRVRQPPGEIAAMLAATVLLVSVLHGARFDERVLQGVSHGISMQSVFLPRS
jgi:hypothetical protein